MAPWWNNNGNVVIGGFVTVVEEFDRLQSQVYLSKERGMVELRI